MFPSIVKITKGLFLIGILICIMAGCQDSTKPEENAFIFTDLSAEKIVLDLCAPELKGRSAGTAGNEKTGEYLADLFEVIKLELLFENSYYMPYEQAVFDVAKNAPSMQLLFNDGSLKELDFGVDYNFVLSKMGAVNISLPITFNADDPDVYNKFLLTDNGLDHNEYSPENVRFFLTPNYNNNVSVNSIHRTASDDEIYTVSSKSTQILISEEVYNEIVLKKPEYISLSCKGIEEKKTANNIIGVIRGEDSTKTAIVSCHYDGAGYNGNLSCDGALDNASGTAGMVMAAYNLSKSGAKPPIDIVFCAFNSEERGLLGSVVIGHHADVIHTISDSPYQLDADEIEMVAKTVSDFVTSNNGEMYDFDSADSNSAVELTQEEAERLKAQYKGKIAEALDLIGGLEYDEEYYIELESGIFAHLMGWRPLSSSTELEEYFPALDIPDSVEKNWNAIDFANDESFLSLMEPQYGNIFFSSAGNSSEDNYNAAIYANEELVTSLEFLSANANKVNGDISTYIAKPVPLSKFLQANDLLTFMKNTELRGVLHGNSL